MMKMIVCVWEKPKSKNMIAVIRPMIGGRYSKNGRSLRPGLNLRASTSVPMIGSLTASQRVEKPVIQPVERESIFKTVLRNTNRRFDTKP